MAEINVKKRIALVNQRYGLEVNGGSELYTRMLAEKLADRFEVEVITTKALDYSDWENYYTKDIETINNVMVRRFDVDCKRNRFGMSVYGKLRKLLPCPKKTFEKKWIYAQGPVSRGLIQYIEDNSDKYDAIIFVTYLYYSTAIGLLRSKCKKTILLPTAHDEPYIYFSWYRDVFQNANGLIYLTPEEKQFVESKFAVMDKINCIAGAGVDVPNDVDGVRFKEKYNIKSDYYVYVGRIDEAKGCKDMLSLFCRYKEMYPDSNTILVLMGKKYIDIPDRTDVRYIGFVDEKDKFDGIKGAKALWLPSKYESLSISVLEAFAVGTPVIVNGECEVLKGHCERSGAGKYYKSEEDCINILSNNDDIGKEKIVADLAKKYISENYSWDEIIERICGVIK